MGQVQTLSLREFEAGGMRQRRFLVALDESLHTTGFVIMMDAGIDDGLVRQTFTTFDEFCARSPAIKRAHQHPETGGERGYTGLGDERAAGAAQANQIEYWHHGRDLPEGHPYIATYSANAPHTDPVVGAISRVASKLHQSFDRFGQRIGPAVSALFEKPDGWFNEHTEEGDSLLRIINSPPCDVPGTVLNFPHTDIDEFAYVVPQPGLEVWVEDHWEAIDAPPGAIAMNVGDMLQLQSAGYYPSAWHRVVARQLGVSRKSLAFFHHPPRGRVLRPTGRFAETAEPLWRHRICTAGWLLMHRLGQNGVSHGPNPYAHEGTNPGLFPPPQRPGVWATA